MEMNRAVAARYKDVHVSGARTRAPTLFECLVEIDALKTCFAHGRKLSSMPDNLYEDACQETVIEMHQKVIRKKWYRGQIVNYGKTIALRTFMEVYRNFSQQCAIPRKAYHNRDPLARHAKVDMSDPASDSSLYAFGEFSGAGLPEDESSNLTDEAMGARILATLDPDHRAHVERVLEGLPDSLFRLTYLVVVLGYGLASACDVMGIRYESGKKYIERLTHQINLGRK